MPAGWVAGASALAGAAENMSANNEARKTSDKNNATAAQLAGAQGAMLTQAEQVAQQPFQAYTGDLTAPLAGNQQQGLSMASKTATDGVAQGLSQQGTSLLDQVGSSTWNSDTAQKYMNPYSSAVTDKAIEEANRGYLQNLSGLQTREAGSGAFGGGRGAIQEAELAGTHNRDIGSLRASGNANAYDSAMKAWQADNQTKLQAANAYQQAGQDVTRMNSQQIQDLMQTGGVARVVAQTNLSNQYDQFMRQQNWSADRLNTLINAYGVTKGSTSQTQRPASNTTNQLLGLASTVAGIYGGGGGFGSLLSSAGSNSTSSSTGAAAPSGTSFESDRRLKHHIEALAQGANGLRLYRFQYHRRAGTFIGYMADEVQKVFPRAVHWVNGFMHVNYGLIPDAIFYRES